MLGARIILDIGKGSADTPERIKISNVLSSLLTKEIADFLSENRELRAVIVCSVC
jgi:hypothetical protein